MEFNREITEKYKSIKEKKNELENQYKAISNEEKELKDFIERCAVFDEAIVFSISQLLSYIEKRRFVPVVYKIYRESSIYPPMYTEDTYVGVAPQDNVEDFFKNESDNVDRFLELQFGYSLYQKSSNTTVSKYRYDTSGPSIGWYNYVDYERDEKKFITFNFLLRNYGLGDSKYATCSEYNFYAYDYVRDFITYIFNLQVENNGRILTYDEIHDALNKFLELEEDKIRIRTLK